MHAAGESVTGRVPKNTVAVALQTRDQAHLLEIAEKLSQHGIEHVVIRECDGEAQAIGITPTHNRKAIRKITGSLPLVK